jgi:predicted GTPase
MRSKKKHGQKASKVLIMGAAGRDFHNFNTVFRHSSKFRVVAFTAAQIQGIAGRQYPNVLAGPLYPRGIPIYPEEDMVKLIRKEGINYVNLAYSDLPYTTVMEKASEAMAAGANFLLLGPEETMLKSSKPVIAVTAVRTGCGKSQTTRYIAKYLKGKGKKVVVIRHPMPYGILERQILQRFENYKDLAKHRTTIEEREEYEPLIDNGIIVYAGVDYEKILRSAEKEADVIIWDGGNNDFPFVKPKLWITIADPLRAGHEKSYYPGGINIRSCDIVIINKENSASKKNINKVKTNVKEMNPKAVIIDAISKVTTSEELVPGIKVLVIEDGPTLTHGGMSYGAGVVAAMRTKAKIVDPRPYATGSIKNIYKEYKHLSKVLPAMGYSKKQIRELEQTINKTPCDVVIAATPIDIRRVLKSKKPIVRIGYALGESSKRSLEYHLKKFL